MLCYNNINTYQCIELNRLLNITRAIFHLAYLSFTGFPSFRHSPQSFKPFNEEVSSENLGCLPSCITDKLRIITRHNGSKLYKKCISSSRKNRKRNHDHGTHL